MFTMSEKRSVRSEAGAGADAGAGAPSVDPSWSPWSGPPRVEVPSPPPEDDRCHPLLEERRPLYTSLTVQRTIATWSHLQKDFSYTAVAKYYQRLEELEETMSPEARAVSRCCERELAVRAPPTSEFFERHFGHIYRRANADPFGVGTEAAAGERRALEAVFAAKLATRRPPARRITMS